VLTDYIERSDLLARARRGAAAVGHLTLDGQPFAVSVMSRGEAEFIAVVEPYAVRDRQTERLRDVLPWIDQTPAMIACLDLGGRFLHANAALRARLGKGSADMLPFGELVVPPDRAKASTALAVVAEGGLPAPVSLRLVGLAEQVIEVEMTASLVRSADGQALGLCAVLLDVSRRNALERDQEAYTHDLEQLYLQLERRSDELAQANADLRQARLERLEAEELARVEQMKSAFLDVAAHELRTPVTIISGVLGCLPLVSDEAPRETLLAAADRAVVRLTAILDTALKLLASGRPDFTGRFKPRSLGKLLRAALDDVQPLVQLRRQRTELTVEPGLPLVTVDASMMRDVVANLVMNAIKFTPDGGAIQISAGLEDDEHCWLAVCDTGIGIAQEDLPFIFDGFFGTLDTKRHSSGSYEFNTRGPGLGLAVVRKFVDHHRGTLSVDSTPGTGTCFRIVLPLRRRAG
jgi:signal transduction histidine kinase